MHTTRFAHHRLHAFHVARSALVAGDALVRKLPRGYGPLGDQMRRALLGAYLQLTEAAARDLLAELSVQHRRRQDLGRRARHRQGGHHADRPHRGQHGDVSLPPLSKAGQSDWVAPISLLVK
jgi:hypothetical protein